MKASVLFWSIFSFFCYISAVAAEPPETCSYETFVWNVARSRSVQHVKVHHSYHELDPEEIDPATGCTVCSEDQEYIQLPHMASFRICKNLAPAVRTALSGLIASGEPVFEVIGYRVGKTRGRADENGNRTGFSNHSYGIALDINPGMNGLYTNCYSFGVGCRLLRGGAWRPDKPGGLSATSPIVEALKQAGFQWGGEIQGRQKDFMHFSPSGY